MRPTAAANRAYVCLPCLLKRCQKSFSTSLRSHSNITTEPESAVQSLQFQSAIQRWPANSSGTVYHNASPGQSDSGQAGTQEKGTQNQLESTESIVLLSPGQLGVIHVLDNIMKKLSVTVPPSTESTGPTGVTINEALKHIQGQKHSKKEDRAVAKLAQAYDGRSLSEFFSDVATLNKFHNQKAVDGEANQRFLNDLIERGLLGRGGAKFLKNSDQSGMPKKIKKMLSAKIRQGGPPDTEPSNEEPKTQPEQESSPNPKVAKVAPTKKPTLMDARSQRAREKARLKNVIKGVLPLRKIIDQRTVGAEDVRVFKAESSSVSEKNIKTPQEGIPINLALSKTNLQTLHAQSVALTPLDQERPEVPRLTHDLSRVLFNPGVYQLQDSRSRVYNFDPYLERIMPVSDFDFSALNEYITSSRDTTLRNLAVERGKKYVGSSSSMTAVLTHFHFLLSQWREINEQTMSRGFSDKNKSFTVIQRSPCAVFLRHQDGVYAIDADKEFDSANVLMSLGKSMEKLLTLEKEDFELYRKSNKSNSSEEIPKTPEAYHYSELGDFLMRSQLDAYDPRLPGTGMFDLKTRAVVSIRMNAKKYEDGVGYEIRNRFGDYESYEREFFDMIRSAFLKYSLQVRMGRMDGIFVAFHNVERIFGFQYVSLSELDMHLHGQSDTTLGDQEFNTSVKLLNEVLDRAAAKFPGRSLRLHFETRNAVTPFMYIFAEPMDEDKIKAIQEKNKGEIDAYEKRIYNSGTILSANRESVASVEGAVEALSGSKSQETREDAMEELDVNCNLELNLEESADSLASSTERASSEELLDSLESSESHLSSTDIEESVDADSITAGASKNDADVSFLDEIDQIRPESLSGEPQSVLAMTLMIFNKVNGTRVVRPKNLGPDDKWSIDYELAEVESQERAQRLYKACLTRREAALSAPQDQDAYANFYLKKLKTMSDKGAEWRKAQDELDVGREVVVLYDLDKGTGKDKGEDREYGV